MLLTWKLKLCQFNIIITTQMSSDWLAENMFNVILACRNIMSRNRRATC